MSNNIINTEINQISSSPSTFKSFDALKKKVHDSKKLTLSHPNSFTYERKQFKLKPIKYYCCSRRRRETICSVSGFWMSFTTITIPTALIVVSFFIISNMEVKEKHPNYIIPSIIILCSYVITIFFLFDVSSADPGRQRGTPIFHNIFNKCTIKKVYKGKKIPLNYCVTCHLIRDTRTFHCSTCGLCVERHDHHCGWVGNCVGIINYKKFFSFLCVLCAFTWLVFILGLHCTIKYGFKLNKKKYLLALLLAGLFFVAYFVCFASCMVGQHITTIVNNKTVREAIKKKDVDKYNEGCKKNCQEALCNKNYKNEPDES